VTDLDHTIQNTLNAQFDERLAKLERAVAVYDRLGGELARWIEALAARVDALEAALEEKKNLTPPPP
jgi:uncharacterized coiled-coil protein SlyX